MDAGRGGLLQGKVAVVTGTGQGIGRGVALQLAGQAAGREGRSGAAAARGFRGTGRA